MSPLEFAGDPEHPFADNAFHPCEPASIAQFEKSPPGQAVSGCKIVLADADTGEPTKVYWDSRNRTSDPVTWSR